MDEGVELPGKRDTGGTLSVAAGAMASQRVLPHGESGDRGVSYADLGNACTFDRICNFHDNLTAFSVHVAICLGGVQKQMIVCSQSERYRSEAKLTRSLTNAKFH